MDKNQPPAYKALLGLSLLFSLAAVLTLIPYPGARWPNVLGYKSLCTFAPAATAACGLLAGVTCIIRSRLVSARAAANRYRPPFVPILVFVLLLAVAIPSTVSWAGWKSAAADASAAASANEEAAE
jgi:hypothetical protein